VKDITESNGLMQLEQAGMTITGES